MMNRVTRKTLLSFCSILLLCSASLHADQKQNGEESELNTSDLSYTAYINSNKRIKCLYGYAADKTGDHETAIRIFEGCINCWNDVYSMLWLAQIYESGVGVTKDLQKSTALMKRGALSQDEAGYSSLARYHYGIALFTGTGTSQDKKKGTEFLIKASREGIQEACDFLTAEGVNCADEKPE